MDASAGAFARAIALAPDNAHAYIELGAMLPEAENAQGAIVLFREGLRRDSAYSRGWYGLARMIDATGTGAEALEVCNTFLDLWPHRDQRYREVRQRILALQGD